VSLLATVTEETHGSVVIAVIDGEVDASNAADIGGRLRSALSNRSTVLIVDLTPTSYIDSAGINLMFELAGDLRERQQALQLVVPADAPIARAVGITGLDAAVPTHGDRETALVAAR
jgi:anti-sigma B factor antagonist